MRQLAEKTDVPGQRLLSKADVLALLGIASYVTLYEWMRAGQFPLAIELGPPGGRSTKIAWLADEVHAWIASRPRRKLRPAPSKPKQIDAPQHQLQEPAQRRRSARTTPVRRLREAAPST
jgi:predicted DNA-binding transcriptional regulator AlpA